MTKLEFTEITLNAADLGEQNPMPDLKNTSYIHATVAVTDRLTDEDKKRIGVGMINTLLPYLSQDNYNRDIKPKKFKAAILENDEMRAVFLPELGGRLWSLYHKGYGKELLYKNEVVQPANLALRNAWVAGGVEWNVGIKGHTPLTCSPLFAAEGKNSAGEPILTMYEYERIRRTAYGINAVLRGDKLFIKTTIENKTDTPTYTYWWSNIAAEEAGVRVLAEADEMLACLYEDNHYVLDRVKAPALSEIDVSYPERAAHAGDVFFTLTNRSRPWIAAVGNDGVGLLQYSTPALRGRKVFFWGRGKGGRNWNRHLTASDRGYIEIQAGLLQTQMEHIEMAPGEVVSFTECYTAIKMDRNVLSGDWKEASLEARKTALSLPELSTLDIPLVCERKLYHLGSGWGAVEDHISDYYDFPKSSIGEDQETWSTLLSCGKLNYFDPKEPPKSYYYSKNALEKLEKYSDRSEGNNWHTHYHIGIMRYALGDVYGAKAAFERSNECMENSWALRNLAMLEKNELGNRDAAVELIKRAVEICKIHCLGLIKDAAAVYTACGAEKELIALNPSLPSEFKESGRIRLYLAIAYMRCGKTDEAKAIMNENFEMPDIKEGELSVSAIWKELYGEDCKLPDRLNFKMTERG